MKKILYILLGSLLILFTSCPNPTPPSFDSDLLIGKWQEKSLFEKYFSNGTGYTWDTIDDISEDEAQKFTWTLENATLIQYHQMNMGGVVPKTYTVTSLSESSLYYQDNYNKSYHFVKVN